MCDLRNRDKSITFFHGQTCPVMIRWCFKNNHLTKTQKKMKKHLSPFHKSHQDFQTTALSLCIIHPPPPKKNAGICSSKFSLEPHLGSDALNGSHGSNGSGQLAAQQDGGVSRSSEASDGTHVMDMWASKSRWIPLPRRPTPRRGTDGDVVPSDWYPLKRQ